MRPQKILFVDDEREVTDALMREVRLLCREEQLQPVTASSASEALSYLQEEGNDVAVLISDLKMPGLKGGDFLRVVADRWPDTIPLVLTGNADLDNVQDFLDAGVQSFLTKPWDRDRLALEIRRALKVHDEKRRQKDHRAFVESELARVRKFQDKLLHGQFPHDYRLGIDLHVSSNEDFKFGGDFVDIKRIDDDRLLLVLADVAGHSLDARYVVGLIQAILESDLQPWLDCTKFTPADFAEWFNQKLCSYKPGGDRLFVALMAIEFDLGNHQIRWVNAGQPPFVIEAQAGSGPAFVTAKTKQYPLGVYEKSRYSQEELPFLPGSRLVLLTDSLHPEGLSLLDYDADSYVATVNSCLKMGLDAAETAACLCRDLGLQGRSNDMSLILIEHRRDGTC
ncbi:MAG: fused response regulator/phosphatase [Spirochaetales bacterium]